MSSELELRSLSVYGLESAWAQSMTYVLQHREINDCIALLLHGRDLNDIIYTGNYAWILTKDPELKGRPKL